MFLRQALVVDASAACADVLEQNAADCRRRWESVILVADYDVDTRHAHYRTSNIEQHYVQKDDVLFVSALIAAHDHRIDGVRDREKTTAVGHR